MSTLIVVGYDDKHRASDVLNSLRRLERGYLVDLKDAIAVCRHEDGTIEFEQNVDYESEGLGWGILWGTLLGSLLAAPFTMGTSAAAGAAVLLGGGITGGVLGAAGGAIDAEEVRKAIGLDPDFVKEVSDTIQPGGSAVLALISTGAPDKVAKELGEHGGTLLKTSLTAEQDAKLQSILEHKTS